MGPSGSTDAAGAEDVAAPGFAVASVWPGFEMGPPDARGAAEASGVEVGAAGASGAAAAVLAAGAGDGAGDDVTAAGAAESLVAAGLAEPPSPHAASEKPTRPIQTTIAACLRIVRERSAVRR